MTCTVERIFITPDHQYKGYFGGPPGDSPMIEMESIQCRAGRGIEGDRYFDHQDDYKGQITFFSMEVYDALLRDLGLESADHAPSLLRRNVFTRGVDLNDWIGKTFEIQGIAFEGSEECRPCFWMDHALTDGAFESLKGRGGLRARIRSDGILKSGRVM